MNASDLKANIVRAYLALAIALCFLVATGLVPGWGIWYSANTYYREQTDAFFHGGLAIQNSPCALRMDLAWHDGGVQQVWGLGVPLWRFLFEITAKVCGQESFPDRIAFGAAYALVAFLLLKELFARSHANESIRPQSGFARLTALIILLGFPPLVLMCHHRFDVYEEASAYSYLYGVALFAALTYFARKQTVRAYLIIALLCGLAPFVRPTTGAYGIATLTILVFYAHRARFRLSIIFLGLCSFFLAGALLYVTNVIRFGAGFEFGHSLNHNGIPLEVYVRFQNPFQNEPLISAARELFGAFFIVRNLNAGFPDMVDVYWGQSPTPRWRYFYVTCYDLSYLFLIGVGWAGWIWSRFRAYAKGFELPLASQVAGLWSMISLCAIGLFYLKTPVISNRYVFDSGPGFAVALAGLLLGAASIAERSKPTRICWLSLLPAAALVWMAWQLFAGKTAGHHMPAVGRSTMLQRLHNLDTHRVSLPAGYELGSGFNNGGIQFNGEGWHLDTGRMDSMVVLFAQDLDFLEILVMPSTPAATVNYSNIKAKVGLELLEVESVKDRDSAKLIRFKPPDKSLYGKGIQVVFLAYLDAAKPDAIESPIKLLMARWRN